MGVFDRFRSSITYPITASLVLLTVVPVFLVGLALAARNRDHLTTLEKQYLNRQAVSLATTTAFFFDKHRTHLESVAVTLEGSEPLDFDEGAELLGTVARTDPTFIQLQIVSDPENSAWVRTRSVEPAAADALTDALHELKQGIEEGSTSFEVETQIPGLEQGVALFGFPLIGPDGEPWGALEGALDLQPLRERIQDPTLSGLFVTLIDDRGRAVLTSDERLANADLTGSSVVRDFVRVPLRLTQVYPHPVLTDEGEMLGAIAPVDFPAWGVLVERPISEAFATVTSMQRRTLFLSAIAAVAALFVGILLSRRLVAPVQDLARVSSAIAAGNLAERAPVHGKDEIARLAENFNQMGQSVEQLVRRLKQAARQNQELFLDTIRTLAAAIDAKDPYTRGHSERVSSYAMAIAKHMGMSTDEVFRIRIGAILHDVGKLGIPDNVLNKPGGLTDEEYAQMKKHAEIGAQIMSRIRMLKDIIPGIRSHHEVWTGGGYPDNLEGEGIPMIARIIGVADTFDAMTTTRPYQKAMTTDYVMAKMRSMAGTRFDPTVVEAFTAAVDAGDITPPRQETKKVAGLEEVS